MREKNVRKLKREELGKWEISREMRDIEREIGKRKRRKSGKMKEKYRREKIKEIQERILGKK